MGKQKIAFIYYDSHTTIKKVFLERMNRARNNYLKCSKNANIIFKSYMSIKQDRKIIQSIWMILSINLIVQKTHI